MSPILRRLTAGLGANAFGQLVNTAIQLLSLPLFLSYWSPAVYGTWLILTALPSYLSMADVGMVTAAGNRMTMAMGQGDIAQANSVFQSAFVFMCVVCGGVALIALPLVLWAPVLELTGDGHRVALAALVSATLLHMFGGLAESVFRATGRYADGTTWSALVYLGAWLGCVAGLALGGSYTAVAIGGLAAQAAGLALLVTLAKRGSHGIAWGWRQASVVEVRAMVKPAVSFMAFPLSNALSFQGITLLVGHLLGPVAVAVFSASRTFARVAVQVTGLFSHALWPEFSRLFGQGGARAVARIYWRSAWVGAAFAIGLSLVCYFAAPWVLRVWTHGAIEFQAVLMSVLLAYAAVGGLWHIPRVLLMATNQHVGLAKWALAAAVLSLVLAALLGRTWNLAGIGGAMLVSEIALALVCIYLARRSLSTIA